MSDPIAAAILQPYQVVDQLAAAFFDRYYKPLRWERLPVTSGSCAYLLLDEHRATVLTFHLSMAAPERTIVAIESMAVDTNVLRATVGWFGRWVTAALKEAQSFPLADTIESDQQLTDLQRVAITLGKRGGGRKSHTEDLWARRELAKPNAEREQVFQQWRQRLGQDRSIKNLRDTFQKNVVDKLNKPEE